MPETYGVPEPEPTRIEQAEVIVTETLAGQGIVRTVVIYLVAFVLVVTPLAPLAVLPLALLIATDKRLS